jgi:predicted transcriptional regulator
MSLLVHPSTENITLVGLLGALADPVRLLIVVGLLKGQGCMSCAEASPCPGIAKSTLSNHFRMLRQAGLIRTTKRGVEHRNVVRKDEIDALFPGLLELVVKLAERNLPKTAPSAGMAGGLGRLVHDRLQAAEQAFADTTATATLWRRLLH